MGKFLIFCRIQLKFCSWLYKKKVDTHHESNEKVIAKTPLTNLYEMNSNYFTLSGELLMSSMTMQTVGIQVRPNNLRSKFLDTL